MKRRFAILLVIAGALMVIGVGIFGLSSIPFSFAGADDSTETLSPSTQTEQPLLTTLSDSPYVMLGGVVWSDVNMNGVRDGDEVGVGRVIVDVYEAAYHGDALFVNSSTTDLNGNYLFASLEPEKSYFVQVHRPTTHLFFTRSNQQQFPFSDLIDSDANVHSGRTTPTYLATGTGNTSIDIGLVPTRDCLPAITFQTDAYGEPLVADSVPLDAWAAWGVRLTTSAAAPHIFNESGERGADADFGGSGLYVPTSLVVEFDHARPVYGLRILDNENGSARGQVQAFDANNNLLQTVSTRPYADLTSQLLVLNAVGVQRLDITFEEGGGITDLIFCDADAPAQTMLGGVVWADLNADGQRAAGESGYSGVAVELRDGKQPDIVVAQTATDGAGRYQFDHLLPGTYQLVVLPPNGTTPSYDIDGTPDGVASALMLTNGNHMLGIDFGFRPEQATTLLDYGDAPFSYGSVAHEIDTQLRLGASVDSDSAMQPSLSADTDDTDSRNDDDGVLFLDANGAAQQVQVTVLNNLDAQSALLSGWIDFNRDGDFIDPGEQIVIDVAIQPDIEAQVLLLDYEIPTDVLAGLTVARFRLSTLPGLRPTGGAPDGEVEDYQLILPSDSGDAPLTYGRVSSLLVNGLQLGPTTGADAGDLYHVSAAQDDSDDGIHFVNGALLQSGNSHAVDIRVINQTADAFLGGWIDWDGDGQFEAEREQVVAQTVVADLATQTIQVSINVPEGAVCGPTYARFRISDRPINATAAGGRGEIEDYRIEIVCPESSVAVGGLVWHDADFDAQQTESEPGLANVTLALYRDDGNRQFDPLHDTPIATTRTNLSGRYLFPELGHATYFVVATDTQWQLIDYHVAAVSPPLAVDASALYEHHFAMTRPLAANRALLGGRVWRDDGDGISNSAELGIANALINVQDASGRIVATARSGATGAYQVEVPANKELWLNIAPDALLAQATATTSAQYEVMLPSGGAELTYDFGYQQPDTASIGGHIWIDDGNNRIDTGETVLPAVTVELIADRNGNGLWDQDESIVATTRSDRTGQYQFAPLPAGTYLAHISDVANVLAQHDLLAGLRAGQLRDVQTTHYAVSLTAGEQMSSADFSYMFASSTAPSGAIGDLVWYETDANGVYDADEAGIANVRVLLLDTNKDVLREAFTDAAGHYLFTSVAAGRYQVIISDTEGVLTNYMPTLLRDEAAVVIDLAYGEMVMGADFGYTSGRLSLGDRIWIDANQDGWQNEADMVGIANVPLRLYVDTNWNRQLDLEDTMMAETITDADGFYTFSGLRPMAYFVVIPQTALQFDALSQQVTVAFIGENDVTPRDQMPLDSNGVLHPQFGIVSNIIDLIGDEVAEGGELNNTIDFGFWAEE